MSFLAKELGISAGVISATIVIVIAMILKMSEPESAAGMKIIIPIIIGIDLIAPQIQAVELFQKRSNFVLQRAARMIMPLAWKAKVFHRVDSLVLA
jgi:hypothetical protein